MGCTSNRQSVHQIGALERKNRADAEQKNALYSGYDDVHDFLPLLQSGPCLILQPRVPPSLHPGCVSDLERTF